MNKKQASKVCKDKVFNLFAATNQTNFITPFNLSTLFNLSTHPLRLSTHLNPTLPLTNPPNGL